MKIALVQMKCPWGEVAGNLRRARERIAEAAARDADLVLFPELSVPGMWKDHLVRLAAEPVGGPIVRRISGWARRHRVAVGFGLAEQSSGRPYNSYVLLDRRGRRAGVYRKNHVTPLEKPFFRKGRGRPVFRLGALRVGVGICADCCDAKLLAGYARRGAELVLMPHGWDADPVLRGGRVAAWRSAEHMAAAHAAGRVRRYRTHDEMLAAFTERLAPLARRGGFHAAFVNQVGRPHPLTPFVGPSFVLDPAGRVIARTRSAREQILLAEVDLSLER